MAAKASGATRPPKPPHVVSARELAAQASGRRAGKSPAFEPLGESSLRGASIIDWSTAPAAIEVAQANPGLCEVLENAALLFASGQERAARPVLEQGIQADPEARQSALAWLALFDLLQRDNDRAAFDQLAMNYVLQFESSAPSWNARSRPQDEDKGHGGYIAITGRLASGSGAQLDGLRRALEKCVPRARIDLASVAGFDDEGARMLAHELSRARRQRMELAIQRPEKLVAALETAVAEGREGGEGAWLLSLELKQWHHDQAGFDDRAVEYAVTFELSPPSWEPPPRAPQGSANGGLAPDAVSAALWAAAPGTVADGETVVWEGVIVGTAPTQLVQLEPFAAQRDVVTIDMSAVERIDFVCAGALLNSILRLEGQHKVVQIVGATPIVRALLLLIGVSPRHFLKKVD
ncbi:MAG: STAS domain-containing protein [Betaproteobacteria bacterium]